ncbi:ferredoxin reductase family protein [Galbitalea soli]|uniref:Oxidoreductase n=1 Tax=Galbitalea soli TaxID=1268042 RepID=A0A7C9TPP7_9MICO|nr:ferredoxin reductase family protein [Galbitalea soli]NEM90084.1 oxidoreductase [Galbitalea soli]NYJ30791.1 putative ferric reductase [Galbitalea soli]
MTSQTPTRPLRVSAPTPSQRALQFKRRMRLADLLVIAGWTSGAASIALYLGYGGAGQFGTLGAAVTSLGILAGLVGTDLILVMLILAARIPIIDRAVGHDRAMAAHRALGKPALYLILAHVVLLIVGYGIQQGFNPIAETVALWQMPDMPLAFLGFGLLIAVVVTSLVVVRRKFRYEFWYVVHLLSYAAVITALPHQFSIGGLLANGTLQRVYWIALYVLALGSILTFRVIEPIVKSFQHGIRVTSVEAVAPGVANIHLSGRKLKDLDSDGGQFFVWRFWTAKTWWHSHPISLSSVPTDTTARITVRALGNGSTRLGRLPRGTRVTIEGPYGLFTEAARTSPKLAIIAAGIGVTPVRALLEHSRLVPGEATILLRASSEDETYLWDEMYDLAAQRQARLYTSIGKRPSRGRTWLSAHDAQRDVSLRSAFPDIRKSDLYICGPQAWTDQVVAEARAVGLPDHQIHTERFDW